MADVKWIKIVTDIFDDEKMLLIESLPSADSIMIIWFKLLCLAGKTNNSGVFIFNDRIPYTDEMLASIFRRDINTVRMALKTFEQFGMIEIIDNVITIPNWAKHQTLDAYERRKERDRLYRQEKRSQQKALINGVSTDKSSDVSSDMSTDGSSDVAPLEEDKDIDKDIDKEESNKEESTDAERPAPRPDVPYEKIIELYNDKCPMLPSCRTISEARKKAIRARMASGHSVEDFALLFDKTAESSFLKGANNRNWRATFDWLVKDSNMAKVLDGNYDDHKGVSPQRKDDLDFIPD